MKIRTGMAGPRTRTAIVLTIGLALAACDSTGPDVPRNARLDIAPSFPAPTLAAAQITEARLILRRLDGSVVVDETFVVDPGATQIELTAPVRLQDASEEFDLTVVLLDAGIELYRTADDPQRITLGLDPTAIEVPMRYVGPGANAVFMSIDGDTVPLTPLAPVTLQAQPADSVENLIPDAPVSWRIADPALADLFQLNVGTDRTVTVQLIGGPPLPDSIDVVAELPRVLAGVPPVSATARVNVEELFGRYDMIQVNGQALPARLPDQTLVLSGVLQLNAALTWTGELVYDVGTDPNGGTFNISGSLISLVDTLGFVTEATLGSELLTIVDQFTLDEFVFRFTREFVVLTVTGAGVDAGTGVGTVTSAPSGISCRIDAGQALGTCQADFGRDQIVRLDALPEGFSAFAGFSGACIGTASCQVKMAQDTTVIADFILGFSSNLPPR